MRSVAAHSTTATESLSRARATAQWSVLHARQQRSKQETNGALSAIALCIAPLRPLMDVGIAIPSVRCRSTDQRRRQQTQRGPALLLRVHCECREGANALCVACATYWWPVSSRCVLVMLAQCPSAFCLCDLPSNPSLLPPSPPLLPLCLRPSVMSQPSAAQLLARAGAAAPAVANADGLEDGDAVEVFVESTWRAAAVKYDREQQSEPLVTRDIAMQAREMKSSGVSQSLVILLLSV